MPQELENQVDFLDFFGFSLGNRLTRLEVERTDEGHADETMQYRIQDHEHGAHADCSFRT